MTFAWWILKIFDIIFILFDTLNDIFPVESEKNTFGGGCSLIQPVREGSLSVTLLQRREGDSRKITVQNWN